MVRTPASSSLVFHGKVGLPVEPVGRSRWARWPGDCDSARLGMPCVAPLIHRGQSTCPRAGNPTHKYTLTEQDNRRVFELRTWSEKRSGDSIAAETLVLEEVGVGRAFKERRFHHPCPGVVCSGGQPPGDAIPTGPHRVPPLCAPTGEREQALQSCRPGHR